MKKLPIILFFLLLMHHASAQKPPHLVPVTITEMVPVNDSVDEHLRFIECRNSDKTVGYLIEPKGDWGWFPGMKGDI